MSFEKQVPPGGYGEPTSTVEVSISCRDLLDMDVFSRSDPMCVVYHHPLGSSHWIELLRTEVVWDCLNPDFVTKLTMDYRFEEEQPLRFEVYDIDSPSASLETQDFLGYSECSLAQIVTAGTKGLNLPLIQNKSKYYPILPKHQKQSKGFIVLTAEELVCYKEEVTLKIQGSCLGQARCCMLPPKTFYILSKVNEAGNYIVVYRSEFASGENPLWKPITISMRSLNNGDKDRCLRIECFQWGFNGYHKSLGFLYTSVNKMEQLQNTGAVPLVGKNGLEKGGSVKLLEVTVAPVYTFMEYVAGGTELHCCFAIDFTASNGDPNDPNSLHHFTTPGGRTNPYEQAIQAVGEIIQEYDRSKSFPVWGFGARVPEADGVSHNFPVTLGESPYCDGIEGVLQAYRSCIRKIQLYGPTNFSPVIKDVANLASENKDGKHYYILLIITDGIITDMSLTKEVVVKSSRLPLSIIIVGVGAANFAAMNELDGDAVRLSFNGVLAERDIVQFVPYRDANSWMASICPEMAGNWAASIDGAGRIAKVKLAQEVLAEIPDQVTGFMKMHSIVPTRRDEA